MADIKEILQKLDNTADTTAQFDPEDIQNNRWMAVLSYFSWLVLIPLFLAKQSKFARYHVNQGLTLAIIEAILLAALNILKGLILVGWIFSIISVVVEVACAALWVLGAIRALQGKAKELPLIGWIQILK